MKKVCSVKDSNFNSKNQGARKNTPELEEWFFKVFSENYPLGCPMEPQI